MTDAPMNHLWCDLETSGLSHERDIVLEVGAVIATPDGRILDKYEAVVQPVHPQLRGMTFPQFLGSYVLEMHEKSGLFDAIQRAEGVGLYDAFDQLWAACIPHLVKGKIVLCGSGVHFDRRFIERDFPRLDALLTYWHLDSGVLRRSFEGIVKPWEGGPAEKVHRALADAEDAMNEWHHYRQEVAHEVLRPF